MSLARNIDYLRRFPKLSEFGAPNIFPGARGSWGGGPLNETVEFGSNPGALRMLSFVPKNLKRSVALVVVMHGCGQTATGYDYGTGWSKLAREYGFALLMPEQQVTNNANACFNWFAPDDVVRGQGEAGSVRQMITLMMRDHNIDPRRVYVTGLSAGGSMTCAMLALYPEVFAAGAIIAGVPFGVASNTRGAIRSMMNGTECSAPELGVLVHRTSEYKGPWPKLSIWHGSADRVVHPSNADAIIRQWVNVHGLPQAPSSISYVDDHPREIWCNSYGETVIESYIVTDMGHGTPLGLALDGERYGEEGAFLIEAGISSTYHIANFFGVTRRRRRIKQIAKDGIDKDKEADKAAVVAKQAEALRLPISSSARMPKAKTVWTWAKSAERRSPAKKVPAN